MQKSITRGLLATSSFIMLSGCGSAEDQQFIKNLSYNIELEHSSIEAEFSEQVDINIEMHRALGEYGTMSFFPSDGVKGFRIAIEIDHSAFLDDKMIPKTTNRLPNGTLFPRYVEGSLGQLSVHNSEKFAAYLYLGLSEEKKYVGSAIALNFIDDSFPSGLTISQYIKNKQGQTIGAVSLYGPKLKDGKLVEPGGIFFVSNINDLKGTPGLMAVNSDGLNVAYLDAEDGFIVDGPNSRKYDSDRELYKLFKKFKKEGRKDGTLK